MMLWTTLAMLGARLVGKCFDGNTRGTVQPASCMACGGSLAGGSMTFDCCGFRTCPDCTGNYCKPLGGGEAIVACRCGDVRRTRIYRK